MIETVGILLILILVILVGLLFVSCIAGIFKAISDQINGYRSEFWPSTTGKVISAEVKRTSDGEGGDLYKPKVRYRYQVDDKPYQSSRITFKLPNPLDNMFGGDQRLAEEAVRRYAIGREVTVYYQPNRPKKAALEPGSSSLFLMLFRVIILAGLAYLIWLAFASSNSPIAPFLYEMADYLVAQFGSS